MPLVRKIFFTITPAVLVSAIFLVVNATPAETASVKPPRYVKSTLAQQKGRSLVLVSNTSIPVNLRRLSRFPSRHKSAPYFCFHLNVSQSQTGRRICLGGSAKPWRSVGITTVNARGQIVSTRVVEARIKRPAPTRLVVTLPVTATGLTPGAYDWNAVARWTGNLCPLGRPARGCIESMPPTGKPNRLEVKQVRPVGCTTGAAGLVTHGPRRGKLVALTLDDGPGPYTAAFLDTLKSKQVPATFFVLGQQVAAYPDLARRIVREGHEIANHSWKHDLYPSAGDLAQTSATIQATTGFKPCSFRPPGGAQNPSVVAGAGRSGMKTILWDVDPFDWRLPGAATIRRIIVSGSRGGSIILSHDAGGNRSQTLAALPGIIDGLRAKGYRFTTVTELLGGRINFRTT